MALIYRDDLKIELKAVPFGMGHHHHLMYRISPDQDLTYHKDYSFLGIKFKIKKKFSTEWHGAYQYLNYPSAYIYSEKPVNPVLLSNEREFLEWKNACTTMKDFFDKLGAIDTKELADWEHDRAKFLESNTTWK